MKVLSTPTPQGTERVLEAFGAKIPLPTWGVTALTALLLIALVIGGSVYGWVWLRDHEKRDDKTLQRVAAAEFVQLEESQRHFGEPPEVAVPIYSDARGLLKVSLFRSDGCLWIERHSADPAKPVVNQFILDPSRLAAQAAPKFTENKLMSLEGVAEAQNIPGPGRCWNDANGPHPGPFTWAYGARSADGCWVQIWRAWADTCQHWQSFNSCNNTWDVAIHWTRCAH
jgi:hypothetical protein